MIYSLFLNNYELLIDIIRQKHKMTSQFELMIIREIEKRNKRKIPYISKLEFLIKREIEIRQKKRNTS